MIKKFLLPLGAIIILLVMVAAMAGYFKEKIEPGVDELQVVNTSAAVPVRRDTGSFTEPVPASVEAKEATIISSRLLARITAIKVRSGDYVQEGQLLLELEKTDLQARARQASDHVRSVEARLTEAQQNQQRADELHQRGLIAVADRDAARANASALAADLSSARQGQEEAESALSFSEIRSPIAGRVVDRFAEPGDTAAPGAKLLSLYNPFSLRVEARVREQLALPLKPGQKLQVEVPSLEKTYEAKIEEIVPAADPGSRSFLVRVILSAEPSLLPGMYARLNVPAGERVRLLIPADRVGQVGQLDLVWVAAQGAILRRFVRLGRATADGQVEVTAGLTEGELVMPYRQ